MWCSGPQAGSTVSWRDGILWREDCNFIFKQIRLIIPNQVSKKVGTKCAQFIDYTRIICKALQITPHLGGKNRLSWEICTADNNKLYDFCCQWLKSWNGAPRSEHSDHEVLNNCKTTDLPQVWGADACPSIRYCPTRGQFSLQSFQNFSNYVWW